MVIPLLYRWIAGAFFVALVTAIIWGTGYKSGVKSMAKDLADCRTSVSTMEAQHDALKRKAGADKQEAAKTQQETVRGWSAAVDYLVDNPRVKRVRIACHDPVRPGTEIAGGTETTPGESGLGEAGTPAAVLSDKEIIDRLNKAERDAARLAWIIHRDEELTRKGLLK